ncbi:MAG: autotransporter outer membrane beta-barrel domain-containing protein [Candidatus Tectomicrobia bacterium]|nr:autotransporter outer membrane beta-barrel domain-containing protein [Candidatus Tectomicrobia bacterium]
MYRLSYWIWAKLPKNLFLAALCACVFVTISTDRAQATAAIVRTCAQIDPTQGGTPLVITNAQLDLTVVAGDRILVTDSDGDVTYRPPGSGFLITPSPAILDVGAGQAGVWIFQFFGSTATVACGIGGAVLDRSNTANHLANTFNQIGGSIFDPDGVPGNVITGGGGTNGAGFALAPNSDPFASRVDTTNPIDRMFGLANEPQGIAALADQTSNKGFNFSVDMRSLIANAQKKDGLGADGMNDGESMPHSRWNSWIAGRYTDFDDDQANADRDGHLWWITSGLSYQFSERTTVGAFSRVRQGEVDSVALNAGLDSDFYGGGVFLVTQGASGVRLLTGALYESGDNDIRIGDSVTTATGSFDSDQWTVEARLDKRINRGQHWIEPAVKVLYTELERDAYTNSIGLFMPGSDITLGRLTFGPTIGTTIDRGGTTIKPFARVNGVWDFENEDAFTLTSGVVVSNADTAINVGGGAEITYANGLVLTAAGDWFSFDSDLDGWSVTGGIGMPLALLGLGNVAPTGLVSLDFTGKEDDLSTKARLRIPLGKTD